VSIGSGSETVKEILEKTYREDLTLEDTVQLAVDCLSKSIEGTLEPEKIRIIMIPASTKKIIHLSNKEIGEYLDRLKS
jgi:proteasome alpha subunit